MEKLDREFDESFRWWGRVYDPTSGGCFYSLSAKQSREDTRFAPDIESTSKLVNVLEWTGDLDDAPPAFRAEAVKYMQTRQDAESGFFRDPQHLKSYTPNALDRALGMARGVLQACGGRPLHPLPVERGSSSTAAAQHYAHLESPDALRAWLEKLPWEKRVWTAGASLRAQANVLVSLPEERRAVLLPVFESFVRQQQREDGFFGSEQGNWESTLSGTYKVIAFLQVNGLPIPRGQELSDSVRERLFSTDYSNSIVLYNTAHTLVILARGTVDYSPQERLALVEQCTAQLHRMRAPDGGFVTQIGKPAPTSNAGLLGLEVIESNANATGLAHRTRSLLLELLTGEEEPHPHPRAQDLLSVLGVAE